MKKAVGLFVAAVFCLSIFAGVACAEDKLAYVDLGRIFGEYKKTKDYDKVLSDKENVFKTALEKKESEFKQYSQKFSLLSQKEQEAKKSEIETKYKTLQSFANEKGADLRKEQDEKMREILKDIQDAVKKYSEQQGYTLVFNDRVLVYQVKSLDISDKIIDILNKGNR